MTYFTERQVQCLLAPIHPNRVLMRDGMSYVEGYDIRAEMNRVFGFGRWSAELLDQACIREAEVKTKTYKDKRTGEIKGGKDAWYVVYRSRIRLTIHAPDGTVLAVYDGSHVGESTHPVFGEAHGNALTNSETYALRRAAINLGDQFGLSLYNKGSLDAQVRWTLVRPEVSEEKPDTDNVPQVSAESETTGDDEQEGPVEVVTGPRDDDDVDGADEARAAMHSRRPPAALPPERIRDEALNITTTPERIRDLLAVAEAEYPDVILQNGNGDDERLVDQLKHISDERDGRQAQPEAKPAAADGEAEWVQAFYEKLAKAGLPDIRPMRVEVMTAASGAKLIAPATANDLLAALDKRKGELSGNPTRSAA